MNEQKKAKSRERLAIKHFSRRHWHLCDRVNKLIKLFPFSMAFLVPFSTLSLFALNFRNWRNQKRNHHPSPITLFNWLVNRHTSSKDWNIGNKDTTAPTVQGNYSYAGSIEIENWIRKSRWLVTESICEPCGCCCLLIEFSIFISLLLICRKCDELLLVF